MLKIRESQWRVLSEMVRSSFIEQEIARLKGQMPEELAGKSIDDTNIAGIISLLTDKAYRYGITGQKDVEAFIDYSVIYGNDFELSDEHAFVKEVLERTDLTGTEKVTLIDGHLLFTKPCT
jgi:hypothetical protein